MTQSTHCDGCAKPFPTNQFRILTITFEGEIDQMDGPPVTVRVNGRFCSPHCVLVTINKATDALLNKRLVFEPKPPLAAVKKGAMTWTSSSQ